LKAMINGADIPGMMPEELSDLVANEGFPAYRGVQLFEWMHRKGVFDPGRMTSLPADLKARLAAGGPLLPLTVGRVLASSDGTRKLEMRLADGAVVETVLIPEGRKLTQCISTQVGCSIGCIFCRSGAFGFSRNLTAAEILAQVFAARDAWRDGEELTNVVFMGIGEPLHNYENTLRAWRLLTCDKGLDLSLRRVTISTAGVVSGIDRLGRDTQGQAALAVSLHGADEAVRQRLVPHLKHTVRDIVEALGRYPLPPRRRFTIEYVLVGGVNDSDADARQLVRVLSGLRVKVNLLPLNPHDRSDLQPPLPERVERFRRVLVDKGMSVFLRRRRGDDISAACGQLLGEQ